jgi:hypothetical protein
MPVRPSWVGWARASLALAFVGHAAANVLFDEREFAAAGIRYRWVASEPLLVQGLIVLLLIAAAGPLARRIGPTARRTTSRRSLLAAAAGTHLTIFLALEITERLAQDEPFVGGLFASLFVPELVFALASALVLAVLASLAVRIARSIRRGERTTVITDTVMVRARSVAPRMAVALAVGERAPPSP